MTVEELVRYTIFVWEGGDKITDHPDDPGGLTKFGIAQRYHPDLDIKNLTLKKAIDIYIEQYWIPMHCQVFLPHNARVAWMMFDMAVNIGVNSAKKILQQAARTMADGIIGSNTIDAVRRMDVELLLTRMSSIRKDYYMDRVSATPSKAVFLRGWKNRCNDFGNFPNEV